jgi:hypothetical protein
VEVARELGLREGWVPTEPEGPQAFDLVLFVPLAACSNRAQMLDALLLALRQEGTAPTADPAQRV